MVKPDSACNVAMLVLFCPFIYLGGPSPTLQLHFFAELQPDCWCTQRERCFRLPHLGYGLVGRLVDGLFIYLFCIELQFCYNVQRNRVLLWSEVLELVMGSVMESFRCNEVKLVM